MSSNVVDSPLATGTSFAGSPHRSRPAQGSKSFSRLESPSTSASVRSRASTWMENVPETMSPDSEKTTGFPDYVDTGAAGGTVKAEVQHAPHTPPKSSPEASEELPIELVSLTDRFIDTLSAKVHPTPPTVDKLSELFQDFYVLAATHISTHISTLSSRQHRESSPTPPASSRSSSLTKGAARAGSASSKGKPRLPSERGTSDQQLLTTAEIEDRRRARKQLERKRLSLEEAVERRACEGVYDRIWRHRSTHDEERDEKLRSRTAALAVVGIGLEDLGIEVKSELADGGPVKEADVRDWLAGARDGLVRMNEEKYPLGKLQHLKEAHKAIVDTLSQMHPSSSSADEILPTMIYTLITTPPEGINVISNLYFIQRFRAESKVDGEAAYCLTNLEAALTFLETVDLTSLRSSEAPSGPPKSTSRPSTPLQAELAAPRPHRLTTHHASAPGLGSTSPDRLTDTANKSPASSRPSTPSSSLHQRRLSHLLQPPTHALGAASDAVMNKADQGFKTIGNTLESSYKLLFGRLSERQLSGAGLDGDGKVVVPKTLDDARKLVGTPPPVEDDGTASLTSSNAAEASEAQGVEASKKEEKRDDKMMGLIGGLGMTRDRSHDSARSGGSGRKVGFLEEMTNSKDKDAATGGRASVTSHPAAAAASAASASSINPAVESMRNLGNTLNPLNRFAGMSVMRPFGRGPTVPPSEKPSEKPREGDGKGGADEVSLGGVADLTTAFPDLAPSLPPKDVPKTAPPIPKFMDIENPGDLKISEVLELLRDYRRLAGHLRDVGAC
ncbi:MAG: hypothetical protein M1832_003578 [Thelocarpon impressellum]|nr:MAG: hypothetical protein M1832_003578 [Thelocarpon impressellum]